MRHILVNISMNNIEFLSLHLMYDRNCWNIVIYEHSTANFLLCSSEYRGGGVLLFDGEIDGGGAATVLARVGRRRGAGGFGGGNAGPCFLGLFNDVMVVM